jgi:RHS repeat-associated protein
VNSSQGMAALYRYDPYGRLLYSSGSLAGANVYRFSSKEIHINSGLYYYGYRFYDPNLQRWLNRDPMGENAGLNLYAFLKNDPVIYIDAYGLQKLVKVIEPPGKVVCDGNGNWVEVFTVRPEDPDYKCVVIHERQHLYDLISSKYRDACKKRPKDSHPLILVPSAWEFLCKSECSAYKASLKCYELLCNLSPENKKKYEERKRAHERGKEITCNMKACMKALYIIHGKALGLELPEELKDL